MFLAVQNSSIGDLVTHSLTHRVSDFLFWHYRVTLETCSEKSTCSSTWHVDTVQLLVTNTEWTYLLQITFIHGFSEEAPWMTCTLIFTFDLLDDVNLSSEVCWCKHFDKYHVCPLCTNLFIAVSTTTMINIITTAIQDQIIPNVTNQTFRSVSFPWPVPLLPSSRPWWAWRDDFGNENYVSTALSSQYQATTDWSKGKPPRSAKTAMYTITWQTLIVRFLCTWRSKLYCCVVWISLVSLSIVFSLIVHNCQTVKKKWKWEIAMIMI